MKDLALYALKVLACSGVLLAVYAILLDRRVRFSWCRAYLLLSPLLAAAIPLLRIPIWPGEVIELTPAVDLPAERWSAEVIAVTAPVATPEIVCFTIYLLGAGLIVGVMLWQVVRIGRLRRNASITRSEHFSLVRTQQPIASFSFFRSIYVWDAVPADELQAIVAHEASHIAHRHSIERVGMECMKAALWWNPFVWLTARRLTEAEEFEADSDVLTGGYEIEHYMKTIFKQLFGYSPEIANGLRDSLTKKRFKMMTTKTSGRYSLLRLAGTLPAMIGLLCAFSFTTRAADIRITEPPKAPSDQTITRADAKKTVTVIVRRDGQPLPGAIIVVAGSTDGTVTDQSGNASINVAPGATLVVSYVGCESQEISVSDESSGAEAHAITLKTDANNLDAISVTPADNRAAAAPKSHKISIHIFRMELKDDVIDTTIPAVGATVAIAGTQKSVVTDASGLATIEVPEGSVLEISHRDCQFSTLKTDAQTDYKILLPPNADLQVKPGTKIRNENGIRPDPLIIVDGIELATSLDQIDPKTIEHISVLKNENSTALYGAKGKNGVILITTKGFSAQKSDKTASRPAVARTSSADASQSEQPFLIVETMPSFQGGDINAYRAWVQERIRYPAQAIKQNIRGRVVVTFVITKEGSMTDLNVLQTPNKLLSDEALRVIRSTPTGAWTPGRQRDEKVNVIYTLPVDFNIKPVAEETTPAAPAGDAPFLIAEVMPSFQGGDLTTFRAWIQQQIRYPQQAQLKKIEGRVVVSFIIEKDGSVSNVGVLQTPNKQFSDEALRVIQSSPTGAWSPGRQRGEAVRVKYTLPVDFRLHGSSTSDQ